jgi:hypothetical protein
LLKASVRRHGSDATVINGSTILYVSARMQQGFAVRRPSTSPGLDRRAEALVLAAIAQAARSNEGQLNPTTGTAPLPGERLPPLVAWPLRE